MKEKIQNSELLIETFGKFPTFYDAEVVQILLKRKNNGKYGPTLEASICIINYNSGEKFLVKLSFMNIFGLNLENFNYQNVLGDLYVSDFSEEFFENIKHDKRLLGVVSKTEVEGLNYYVKFEYCFGIEAKFLCSGIVIDSVNLWSDDLEN